LTPRSQEASVLDADAEDAPVVQLMNLIMRKAIQLGASDIHIEPGVPEGTVRFRLDGLLSDQLKVPVALHPALVSRMKILGRLDIAERRLPQDRSVRVTPEGQEVDLRISTIPLQHGEKAVLRVLGATSKSLELEDIGLNPSDVTQVHGLTGHLVFTTLHTNDAPSTITRLLDIGVPRYLVASVMIGIIAQRLVRVVCSDCKAPAQPDTSVATALGLSAVSLAGGQYAVGK